MATIRPTDDFDPELRASQLREAMKGIGTDEAAVIAIIARHTNAERQDIASEFKTKYGEDLEDRLKSELSGNMEDVTLALMTPPTLYDARELHRSMKGAGTDEATLIEIMCSRSNEEIAAIKEAYTEEFGRDLEKDLRDDCSGQFKRLMVSQCNAGRNEDPGIDYGKAREDAQRIYDAGENQWGTDEAEIQSVLCSRSYPQLKATFDAYESIAGKDIEEAIESECSGTLQDGYLAIIKYAKSPSSYFAERLYKSMKGAGTDDETLIRVVVSRSEIDLGYIKVSFASKYESSLADTIEGDCGGDYKNMLLEIVNAE